MLKQSRPKRVRRVEGAVVQIPLGHGKVAYGLVLREPLVAVFDREFNKADIVDCSALLDAPIAFQLMVMNYAITDGEWRVVGRVNIPEHLLAPPPFFKQDPFTGRLSIYQEVEELAPHYERDATLAECKGLEKAAVWDPEHVEDRLRDRFAGRPNVWAEQLQLKEDTA